MKSTLAAVLAAGLISAGPVSAALVTIDFESAPSFASIGNFYSGLGVSFGPDAQAIQNDALGPYFSNAPSPIGIMAPVGTDAAMNVVSGFNGVASLYYSASGAATVSIWSGLNGTGSALGAFNLTNNSQSNGCADSPYCNWTLASFDLGLNVAKSITFGNATNLAGFDNVSVNEVPLPAALPLLAFGLAGMGTLSRRRKKAAV